VTIIDLLGNYLGPGSDNFVSRLDEQVDDAGAQARIEPGPHVLRGHDFFNTGIIGFHFRTSLKSRPATGRRMSRRRVAG
jgi:hypothetical protein